MNVSFKKVIETITPKRKAVYIFVKETKIGIETYANVEDLKTMPSPLKKQVMAFFESCLSELKGR